MRRFLTSITWFSIPLVILLVIPIFFLKISGESYTNIDNIIESNRKYLIGYAYDETNYKYLKWKELTHQSRKDIVVVGSSRVLQFRKQQFDSSFYNAGYTISSITDFIPFLKEVPANKYPKVLLIGLDQWMYNKKWDDFSIEKVMPLKKWNKSFTETTNAKTLIKVWKDLFAGKYGISTLLQEHQFTEIGLNAFVNNTGFRNDGSMFYGSQIRKLLANDSTADDYAYRGTYDRINSGSKRFEYGNEINPNALLELDSLLFFCKQNKIFVVAVIPPFANGVTKLLQKTNKYGYMEKIYSNSLPIFEKYGFELHDMSNLSYYKSSDNETLDGFHGGEITYMKILIKMIDDNSVLKNYTSKDRLKIDLGKKINNYQVYN